MLMCVFISTVVYIVVTFLVCMQLVSIPIKSGNVTCVDNGFEAWIRSLYDASTDLQRSFTACTWGVCDISPGGSIYVQNKQEVQQI